MVSNPIFWLIGGGGLIFRIWLAEFKLREELGFRRRYLSRIVNYHLLIAILLGFENAVFNAILIACYPVMILTTVWDVQFYRLFRQRGYWKKNRGWLVVERLTLHPPILICGTWLYLVGSLGEAGFGRFLPRPIALVSIALAMLLVWVPFFLLDSRWTARYNWPQAPIMITIMTGANLALIAIAIFDVVL